MTIAICDDERQIREGIKRNIRLIYKDVQIVQFEDAASLLSYGDKLDILFLDIQMDGINGIEAARRLRKARNNVTIIFVTAIEEYVFQAFDVKAFHYLVKPIRQTKFFAVLREAVEDRKQFHSIDKTEKAGIVIKKGTVTQRVYLSEIIYLEVFNRKVTLHTAEKDFEFYGKLVELEKNLGEDFVRCHRAFIVNLRYVLKYDSTSITLDDGRKIILAKQKYAEFVRRYMQWLREAGHV